MRARLTAIAVSLFAHGAAVALLVIGLPWSNSTGAVDQGLHGIEISLAAGGIPSVPAPPPPAPEPDPEPQKVEEKPVEPEPEVAATQETPPVIASRSEEPAIEEVPKPDPKPRPQRRPPPPKPEAVKPPEPKVAPAPAPAPAPERQTTEVAAAPVSPGAVGERVAPGAGSGAAATSGGNPGLEADYYARLLAWLEKHKEYPRGAQLRRQQGVAHLRFSIDSTGRVLSYRLERSSGYETLDDAVERMIRRAGQLPPIPAALGKERLDLVVPVQFFLRQR